MYLLKKLQQIGTNEYTVGTRYASFRILDLYKTWIQESGITPPLLAKSNRERESNLAQKYYAPQNIQ